ncbi:MAG: hypothetical protein RLZZ230_973 [Candidatus Parcubacteria bacterium]|jgi:UDP-N-acetylglucosamine 2-epimerase (non-hydrolysing)
MKRISVIVGTRPEAIKLAPLIIALRKQSGVILSVCITGQHTDMVQSVLEVFEITPDKDFSVMGKTNNLNDLTGLLLSKFQEYYLDFKPDIIVVQGDTSSVFAGAVAAFNLHIPVAHVEAGLRSNNLESPWPEEGIRRMVTQIASYHFTPTSESAENIKSSGVTNSTIEVSGNTVIDALHQAIKLIEEGSTNLNLPNLLRELTGRKMVLVTGHRRENFGDGLHNLCVAIATLAKAHPEYEFIFPVHLNPVVQSQVKEFFSELTHTNVHLIEPLPYLEFVWLMKNSHFIITDSGGIQEEAPSLGKPVLVTRDTTERPEGVQAGTVVLVGKDSSILIQEALRLMEDELYYKKMSQAVNPYGDGKSVERIIKTLIG